MTDLRAKARDRGVYLRVVRNTLARRAVPGTRHQCLGEALVGPILLAVSQQTPGAAASLLKDFAKDHEALKVKALFRWRRHARRRSSGPRGGLAHPG